MGARTNFTFITADGALTLYSHWGGESKFQDLARALERAQARQGDTSYELRIIISQLIGQAWDSETGFGLFVGTEGGEESYETCTVFLERDIVMIATHSLSIQDFIDSQRVRM